MTGTSRSGHLRQHCRLIHGCATCICWDCQVLHHAATLQQRDAEPLLTSGQMLADVTDPMPPARQLLCGACHCFAWGLGSGAALASLLFLAPGDC